MEIGCHALVWTGDFEGDGVRTAVDKTKRAGFDLVEFPLMEPSRFNTEGAVAALQAARLQASASLGLSERTDISSEEPAAVRSGAALLHNAVEVAERIGSRYLTGVIYGAMQKHRTPATRRGLQNSVGVIQELADHAARARITLGLEVVNRYESNLLNTADQALRYLDLVDRGNVRIHLDTYHMNIEEADTHGPVARCGDRLGYVHVGENHRGYVGSGHVAFDAFFRALAGLGYDGPVVFESFSAAVVNVHLSNALGIWREVWSDGDDVASHACQAIRGFVRAARESTASHSRTGALTPTGAPEPEEGREAVRK